MAGLGYFTPAKEEDRRWTEGQKTEEDRRGALLTGDEARDFYQSLFTGENQNEQKEERQRRRRRRRRRRTGEDPHRRSLGVSTAPPGGQVVSERDGHRLLRSAQDGDVQAVVELLDLGCDVNFRDGFFWTPLMCASHAGQVETVRLLLTRQAAWVGVVDTQGRDARTLALQAGHQDVVTELDRFGVVEISDSPAEPTHGSGPRWCEVCEVSYSEHARTHTCSTLHQFSLNRPPGAPQFCLPESSVSYRMMLRSGWDPRSGLGPSHSGRRQPVGTVLKRDQSGLGFGPQKSPKITHFRARDPKAVSRAEPTEKVKLKKGASLTGKELKKREEREKQREIDFRNSFHFDI